MSPHRFTSRRPAPSARLYNRYSVIFILISFPHAILKVMSHYSAVTILYNPISTGSSRSEAEKFAAQFKGTKLARVLRIRPTKYAGHAETLAYELAKASPRPLIVSSSGDGGYHELINGIMRARAEGAAAVAGLLPAGNANDHYHHMHRASVKKDILAGKSIVIDVMLVTITTKRRAIHRYAHSYVGIGLTPQVGQQLNKTKLKPLQEIWIVGRELFRIRPVRILVDGEVRTYDSLVCSNVGKMSKILHISRSAYVNDGKFEITAIQSRNRLQLIRSLWQSVARPPARARQEKRLAFQTIKRTPLQLDGEILKAPRHATVEITILPRALPCII